MTTTIIPCVYNSFSFTRNNILEDMCILDIQTKCSHSAPPALPPPPPPPPQNRIVSVTDTDSESEFDSDSESESEFDSDSDVAPLAVAPLAVAPLAVAFDLTTMSKYLYTPNVKNDTLLWCAYIMIHGIEKFECVENHYTESNSFKFQMVEYIRARKTLLKPHKMTASSVEESLVHKPYISLETFQGIAVCYNLSVCIIQDRKIFEVGRSDNDKNTFILEKIRGKFGVYIVTSASASASASAGARDKTAFLAHVREKYWSMENISSPIRSISAYKVQDLIDICKKLEIPETKVVLGDFGSIVSQKKKTKAELYEDIVRMIMS
jgi:hypothetical protein